MAMPIEIWRVYLPHALYLGNSKDFQRYRYRYDGLSSKIERCLQSDGRYNEALILFTNVLETRETALGPEHPDTLTSVHHLGSVFARLGKYEEAEAMQQRALEGQEEVLGPEHPDTLTSMNILAHTLISQDKFQDALALMEKCVELRNRLLGHNHPDDESSSRFLNAWKKNYTSLSTQQLQNFVQVEYDQIQEISTERSREAVATNLTDEQRIAFERRTIDNFR